MEGHSTSPCSALLVWPNHALQATKGLPCFQPLAQAAGAVLLSSSQRRPLRLSLRMLGRSKACAPRELPHHSLIPTPDPTQSTFLHAACFIFQTTPQMAGIAYRQQ